MSETLGGFGDFFPLYFGAVPLPSEEFRARTASGNLPVGRAYITFGGERLDQVAQTVYGAQQGVVEALLVANPGLADQGFELPANLAIELPELVLTTPTNKSREVALWGS